MSTSALSSRFRSPLALTYILAILSTAVAIGMNVVIGRWWGVDPSLSLFLCAVVFAAWVGGPGPALLATALTILTFDYLFLPPIYSFALATKEIARLMLFAVAALFVVLLSTAQRRAAASLRLAHERQQRAVEELQELNAKLRIENAERRQAEQRARRAEEELQLTIDTMPVLAARYRPDGFMEFRNRNWRDYTGLSQDNVEGNRWGGALHPDDHAMVEREWRSHIANDEPFDLEQRLRRADGEYRWHWVRRVPLRNESGEVIKWYGVAFDIHDRKRVEDALRQSQVELAKARHEVQLIIDTVPVLILRHRGDGIIDFVNQVGRSYSGLVTTKWTRRTSVITHPDDVPRLEAAWDVALATGEAFESEARLRRFDGEYRWFATRRVPLRNDDGEVIAWYAATYDIEDRKRAEEALRRSEADLAKARQDLQLMIDTISTMVVVLDAEGKAYFANKPAQEYVGHDFSVENVRDLIHPDDRERVDRLWRTHLLTGEPFHTEQRMLRADGQYRWNYMTRTPLRDDTGKVIKWYGSGYDIEDRKRAENALRASEAQLAEARRELELTIDSIPVMVSTFEADGTRSYVNKTWQDYTGHTQREATGKGIDTSVYYHLDDVEQFNKAWHASQARGEMLSVDVRTRRADGVYRWYTMRRAPRRDDKGSIVKWYSVGIDVEEQKVAEKALRDSEARLAKAEAELRTTLDTIPTLAWRARADGFAEYLNERWLDYTGFSLEQALGWDWQAAVHPDDLPNLLGTWRAMLASNESGEVEARMRRFDGAYRWFLFRTEPFHDETGAVIAWYGTNTDIEDRKQAENTLHAMQSALANASRVATLGEISATIAHEVNQPLAAILANGQACLRFLRRETPDLNSVRGAVEWIVKDSNRAGEVIRRIRGLLKNADTQRAPLDANDLIREVATLLERELINKQVILRLELGSALALMFADRVQLQQVIINLILNGAEAMQGVAGRPRELVVQSYVDEAHRVVIAVKDSGIGIPDGSADRVFEPFFSTKPGGLGMGLSICRSIVEAHGGRLWSSASEPGATFQFAVPPPPENAAREATGR
jgi:PAS domain S-box-containing protein